jgi:hypothetical protein
MVRKISILCALATALFFPIGASAYDGHGHMHGGPGWHGHMHGGPGWHGHGGRWWHGRYWGYGSPCWRWTPAGWIWICRY